MEPDSLEIRHGLPYPWRSRAAELYFEAFRRKLAPILPPPGGAAVLQESFNSALSITAFADGGLVGLLGFQHSGRRFLEIARPALARRYGWLGGLLKAAALSVFARPPREGQLLLDGIAVHPAARGRGVGTRLIGAALDLARCRGLTAVRLDVVDTNPNARRLYERLGFAPTETVRYPYLGPSFGFAAVTTMVKEVP